MEGACISLIDPYSAMNRHDINDIRHRDIRDRREIDVRRRRHPFAWVIWRRRAPTKVDEQARRRRRIEILAALQQSLDGDQPD